VVLEDLHSLQTHYHRDTSSLLSTPDSLGFGDVLIPTHSGSWNFTLHFQAPPRSFFLFCVQLRQLEFLASSSLRKQNEMFDHDTHVFHRCWFVTSRTLQLYHLDYPALHFRLLFNYFMFFIIIIRLSTNRMASHKSLSSTHPTLGSSLLHIGAWCEDYRGPYSSNIHGVFQPNPAIGAQWKTCAKRPRAIEEWGLFNTPESLEKPVLVPHTDSKYFPTSTLLARMNVISRVRTTPIQTWEIETARQQPWCPMRSVTSEPFLLHTITRTSKAGQKTNDSEVACAGSREETGEEGGGKREVSG
jgi:hypothetical protein